MFNGGRLAAARERRAMTAKSLAAAAGVAPLTITRLERGESKEPSPETLAALARVLAFPVDFFSGPDLCDLTEENVSFRTLGSTSAQQRKAARIAGKFGHLLVERLSQRFNLPPLDLPETDRGTPPDAAARLLRQAWGLGDRPISHLVGLLESRGIRVLSLREDNLNVDALSFWEKGVPFILLNIQKSAERTIYDAAHELGHLVLHQHITTGGDTRQAEREANDFAAAFLMPEADVRAHRPRGVSVREIIRAKSRWRVSAMALTHRLHDLGLLTDWQSRSLYVQLGQMGYRSGEPVGIEREKSALWPALLSALWKEGLTRDHLAKDIGLPPDEVHALINGLLDAGGSRATGPSGPRAVV